MMNKLLMAVLVSGLFALVSSLDGMPSAMAQEDPAPVVVPPGSGSDVPAAVINRDGNTPGRKPPAGARGTGAPTPAATSPQPGPSSPATLPGGPVGATPAVGGTVGTPVAPGPASLPGSPAGAGGPTGTPAGTPGAAPGGGTPVGPEENSVDKPPSPDANAVGKPSSNMDTIKCKKLDLNETVSLDFRDMPLDDLVRLMSCWTGKNFLLAQALSGKTVTLISPEQVTAEEAYKAFLSVLRVHGLTLVPAGKFLKIVPEGEGKTEPIPLLRQNSGVPDDDSMVTKIVKLKYVPASEMAQVLNGFKSKSGEIIAYGEETLIITDTGTNVRRLMKFVRELDQPTDKEKIWVRQIQYAGAADVVEIVNGVFGEDANARRNRGQGQTNRQSPQPNQKGGQRQGAQNQPGPSNVEKEGGEAIRVSKIIADERTNQIVIVCNSTTYMQVDKLIRRVDVPIPGEGQIHIYYLENADAEELASTLSGLTSGGQKNTRGGSKGGNAPQGQGAQPAAGAPAAAGGGGGQSVAGLFQGEVKVTAHKQTNSLIIEASYKDFLSLKKVIEKLDIRRKQVYVEAIIMEISSNKERKFGVSGSAGTTFDVDGETIPLLMGLGGLGVSGLDMNQLLQGGLATGLQGPLVDVSTGSGGAASGLSGDLSIPTFGFLIQAIASNSDVNILSTPHILTTDNEEAEIQVGKQIPYRAATLGGLGALGGLGSSLLSGTNSNVANSAMNGLGGLGVSSLLSGLGGGMVQRIDVDLTLKITPHVNESNYVRLEIDQSIEDVESIDRELGPTTSKRKVKNTVIVRDQQPVVIGGLIRDTESEGIDKVPFLGDIPLIGVFFRKTITTTEKKNLLMIIIPHIIDDPSDLERIHRERMDEIHRFAQYMDAREMERNGIIDYNKKNGAVEAMRRSVEKAREERAVRERQEFEGTAVDLVGPPESHELDYDPTAPKPESAPQK